MKITIIKSSIGTIAGELINKNLTYMADKGKDSFEIELRNPLLLEVITMPAQNPITKQTGVAAQWIAIRTFTDKCIINLTDTYLIYTLDSEFNNPLTDLYLNTLIQDQQVKKKIH